MIKLSKNIQISIVLVVVLVGIAILLFPKENVPTNNESFYQGENNTFENNTFITMEKVHEFLPQMRENLTSMKISQIEKYPITSKPNFKIGEKYSYRVKTPFPAPVRGSELSSSERLFFDHLYFNITFTCDKKERINRTDFYVISTQGSGEVLMGYAKTPSGQRPITSTRIKPTKIYINTETGETQGKDAKALLYDVPFYSPWMLKLKEDLKWGEITNPKTGEVMSCVNEQCQLLKKETNKVEEESYEVKGIEDVLKRKCFRVEVTKKECKNEKCKIMNKKIYWVDVEKRITIKFELYYQNLLEKEFYLTNANEL